MTESSGPPHTTSRSLTPLLELVRAEALEQEYHEAAAARSARHGAERSDQPGHANARPGTRATAATVVGVFGLLVTLGVVQASRNSDVAEASRAQVLDRIQQTDQSLDAAQDRVASLRAGNAASERSVVALGNTLADVRAQAADLELRTGFTAVSGPGIRITFENLPSADPSTEWVRDSDLAALVNGLWAAGAEAVSVNGQRITAVTGIRNVGNTVEINQVGVGSPYTVLAIGSPNTLAADLLDSDGGSEFFSLAQQFGWKPDPRNAAQLRIPAAPAAQQRLRSAEHLDDTGKGEAP